MAEQEVFVGEAQVEDAASLATLLRKVPTESDFLTYDEMQAPLSKDQVEEYILSRLDSLNQICLVAKLGQQVVGVLNVTAEASSATQHIGDLFIAVSKPYWGYGLGHLLMEALIDWAEQTPLIARLELTVQARNERAVHLYQDFGFAIEGTKKRGAKTKNGEFLDVYLMAKLIDG